MKLLNLNDEEKFDLLKVFHEEGLYLGRMIAPSKSSYRNEYPDNLVVFNANIVLNKEDSFEKIWYGDLDITKDYKKLKKISNKIDYKIFVLYEMDARFENEYKPKIKEAVWNSDIKETPNYKWYMEKNKED